VTLPKLTQGITY